MQRLFSPPLVVGLMALVSGGLLIGGNSRSDTVAAVSDGTVEVKTDANKQPAKPGKKQLKAEPLPDGVIPFAIFAPVNSVVRKRHAEIEKALQTQFTGETKGELKDVLKKLADHGKLRIVIDEQALADEGIMTDTEVRGRFKDATVEQALRRILRPLALSYLIQDEAVFVTTDAKADEILVTRTYAVGDLKTPHDDGSASDDRSGVLVGPPLNELPSNFAWLRDAIQSETSGPWFNSDGVGGTMSIVADTLVIRQTRKVHMEIAGLLKGLRLAKAGKLKGSLYFIHRKYYPHKKDALIRRKLAERMDLTFKDVPLYKAMRDLQTKLAFTIVIEHQALADEGIMTDAKINRTFHGVALRSALRELMSPLGLTFLVEEGTLVVTTTAHADETLHTAIFDVSHLLKAGVDSGAIVDMIQQETAGPWFNTDGVGGAIVANTGWGIVIVRQTEKVQTEIAVLLADTKTVMAKMAKHNPKPVDSDRVETRLYPLDAADLDGTTAKQTVEVLMTFVAPKSWKQNDAVIKMVDNKLVIRQTHKVHTAIQKFLDKLNPSQGGGFGSGSGLGPGGFSGAPPRSGFFSR